MLKCERYCQMLGSEINFKVMNKNYFPLKLKIIFHCFQAADELKQPAAAKFDPETDPKLKEKPEVVLSTLSSDVSSEITR